MFFVTNIIKKIWDDFPGALSQDMSKQTTHSPLWIMSSIGPVGPAIAATKATVYCKGHRGDVLNSL